MPPLRILIADDHQLIQREVKALLEVHPEWTICADAKTGTEAVAKAKELKPDIVILDLSMPDLGGLEAAKRILSASENVEVLILSMHSSYHLLRECIKAGVRGYVVKSDAGRHLVIAIETIAKHQPFFTSSATEVILKKFNSSSSESVATVPDQSPRSLTPRERQIVQLISDGKSGVQIAIELGISAKTAETHRSNIMRKLHLHSVAELVRYAVRNEIVDP